jgi:DNA-binding response OmpR family regulator
MRLLIIEDEQEIALPLKKALERHGFAVDHAVDGEKGLGHAQINNYDCILLDLNLPGIDGMELCLRLREAQNSTPIIMVTARSQQYDKISGLQTGADDYVTKPFDFQELLARVQALIRRTSRNVQPELQIADLTLIPERNLVKLGTADIELSTKETGVLEYLLRNQGRYVSAEELLEHVWDSEIDTFSDTVKTHIKTLRQKVDPQKQLIHTTRGKGYIIK